MTAHRFFRNCALALMFILPASVAMVAWKDWPAFSVAWDGAEKLENPLIAIASVAGVLWSGVIVAYSIHQDYTPRLRTSIQLLHFSIFAPLLGLIATGAMLRTAFLVVTEIFLLFTVLSFTFGEFLTPGFFSVTSAGPRNSKEDRDKLQQISLKTFSLIAHGAWYFLGLAVASFVVLVFARQDIIAWVCIFVLITSLLLLLPELFSAERSTKSQ